MARSFDALATYIAALVEAHPEPPRPVRFAPLITGALRQSAMRIVVGGGLLIALVGAEALLSGKAAPGGEAWLMWAMPVFGGLMVLGPTVFAMRVRRALSSGHLAEAEVIGVTYLGPGAMDTLDAVQNGIARGRWRVRAPNQLFEEDFETDEPWAAGLQPGGRIRVLVDPKASRVLFPLGPADGRNAV